MTRIEVLNVCVADVGRAPRAGRVTAALLMGLVVLVVALVVGGGVVASKIMELRRDPETQVRGGGAVAVEVSAVRVGLIRDVRLLTGSLQARAHFEVAARISGRLERLAVDIGDVVERGQVVAELDDQEYQQQLEQSRAELMVAQATLAEKRSGLEITQRDFGRVRELYEQRIASESELDGARSRLQAEEAAVAVAEAQVAQRQAAVRAAEVRLSYTRIVAWWQGGSDRRVVGERFVNEGSTVAANAPLISLVDLDTLTAVVFVTEREHGLLAVGQEATVSSGGGRQTGASVRETVGRVARIAPVFREGSRQARVEIEVPNPDLRLSPGMFVRVGLELSREESATIIPRQALLRREGREGVFVVDPATEESRFVPVRVGIVDRDRVQVLESVIEGPVVTLGQHLLGDGTRVAVQAVAEPEVAVSEAGGAVEGSEVRVQGSESDDLNPEPRTLNSSAEPRTLNPAVGEVQR